MDTSFTVLLLFCIADFTAGKLVPNEYVKTSDGKKTDIVTGLYYSLFNYGHFERQRGGLVTFYVNDDEDNRDLDDDLNYKTLILDKGINLKPGGRNYESTLFALKKITGYSYQIFSLQLQGPVAYKKLNADEFTLVVYGLESNMNEQLQKSGKYFNSTLFTLKKANSGHYQLISRDLNAVIDYSGDVPRYPRELLLRNPNSEVENNLKASGRFEQGSHFKFTIANIYQPLFLPLKMNTKPITLKDSDFKTVSKVVFSATNNGSEELIDTYLLTYSEKLLNTIETLDFYSYSDLYFVDGGPFTNLEIKKWDSILVNIELELKFSREREHTYGTSNATEITKELVASITTSISIPEDTKVTVELQVSKYEGSHNVSVESRFLVRGKRLNEDGSATEDTELDIDAIVPFSKSLGINNKLTKSEGKLFLFSDVSVHLTLHQKYSFKTNSSVFYS